MAVPVVLKQLFRSFLTEKLAYLRLLFKQAVMRSRELSLVHVAVSIAVLTRLFKKR